MKLVYCFTNQVKLWLPHNSGHVEAHAYRLTNVGINKE
jgi:hypothetical protein